MGSNIINNLKQKWNNFILQHALIGNQHQVSQIDNNSSQDTFNSEGQEIDNNLQTDDNTNAAKCSEEKTIPESPITRLEILINEMSSLHAGNAPIVSLDIGGSLIKCVCFVPDTVVADSKFKISSEFASFYVPHLSFSAPRIRGRFLFFIFPNTDFIKIIIDDGTSTEDTQQGDIRASSDINHNSSPPTSFTGVKGMGKKKYNNHNKKKVANIATVTENNEETNTSIICDRIINSMLNEQQKASLDLKRQRRVKSGFKMGGIQHLIRFLQVHNFPWGQDKTLRCTGGGAIKYKDILLKNTRYESVHNVDEIRSLVKGLSFVLDVGLEGEAYSVGDEKIGIINNDIKKNDATSAEKKNKIIIHCLDKQKSVQNKRKNDWKTISVTPDNEKTPEIFSPKLDSLSIASTLLERRQLSDNNNNDGENAMDYETTDKKEDSEEQNKIENCCDNNGAQQRKEEKEREAKCEQVSKYKDNENDTTSKTGKLMPRADGGKRKKSLMTLVKQRLSKIWNKILVAHMPTPFCSSYENPGDSRQSSSMKNLRIHSDSSLTETYDEMDIICDQEITLESSDLESTYEYSYYVWNDDEISESSTTTTEIRNTDNKVDNVKKVMKKRKTKSLCNYGVNAIQKQNLIKQKNAEKNKESRTENIIFIDPKTGKETANSMKSIFRQRLWRTNKNGPSKAVLDLAQKNARFVRNVVEERQQQQNTKENINKLFTDIISKETNKKLTWPFILVQIGSGVSVIHVKSRNSFMRVGGSVIGGATFLGLANLITNFRIAKAHPQSAFQEFLKMSLNGNSNKIDMVVSDIYGGEGYGGAGLDGDIVAACFGKAMATVSEILAPSSNTRLMFDDEYKRKTFSPFEVFINENPKNRVVVNPQHKGKQSSFTHNEHSNKLLSSSSTKAKTVTDDCANSNIAIEDPIDKEEQTVSSHINIKHAPSGAGLVIKKDIENIVLPTLTSKHQEEKNNEISSNSNETTITTTDISDGSATNKNGVSSATCTEEDIICALLKMVALNIAQIAYYTAKEFEVKNIVFSGSFVQNHPVTKEMMNFALNFFSQGQMKPIFLYHESVIGALGAMMDLPFIQKYVDLDDHQIQISELTTKNNTSDITMNSTIELSNVSSISNKLNNNKILIASNSKPPAEAPKKEGSKNTVNIINTYKIFNHTNNKEESADMMPCAASTKKKGNTINIYGECINVSDHKSIVKQTETNIYPEECIYNNNIQQCDVSNISINNNDYYADPNVLQSPGDTNGKNTPIGRLNIGSRINPLQATENDRNKEENNDRMTQQQDREQGGAWDCLDVVESFLEPSEMCRINDDEVLGGPIRESESFYNLVNLIDSSNVSISTSNNVINIGVKVGSQIMKPDSSPQVADFLHEASTNAMANHDCGHESCYSESVNEF